MQIVSRLQYSSLMVTHLHFFVVSLYCPICPNGHGRGHVARLASSLSVSCQWIFMAVAGGMSCIPAEGAGAASTVLSP